MTTPSTGRAEDPKHLCRDQSTARRIHQQASAFILLESAETSAPQKGFTTWCEDAHLFLTPALSFPPHSFGVSAVAPLLQPIPRNTDRCCHSL